MPVHPGLENSIRQEKTIQILSLVYGGHLHGHLRACPHFLSKCHIFCGHHFGAFKVYVVRADGPHFLYGHKSIMDVHNFM